MRFGWGICREGVGWYGLRLCYILGPRVAEERLELLIVFDDGKYSIGWY